MQIPEKLMMDFRLVTGLSEAQIAEEVSKCDCYTVAILNFYKMCGRFPTENECAFMDVHGFHAYKTAFNLQLLK